MKLVCKNCEGNHFEIRMDSYSTPFFLCIKCGSTVAVTEIILKADYFLFR